MESSASWAPPRKGPREAGRNLDPHSPLDSSLRALLAAAVKVGNRNTTCGGSEQLNWPNSRWRLKTAAT
ncbi:hypothetical protein L596_018040 [Steinernema carpocapsae]|uniref:Uncharacterized protein n=1 Tax=Steinernema carpocapsae TaxID=34508 RepID=A0A4U5N3G5_STECR|nr:hypothetical protein L596_018040 [Steinernema carpocapsae]